MIGFARPVFAQAKPAPATSPAEEPQTLFERVQQPDQGGGVHLTKHFAVVFGGIKAGSGIALGPALSWKFADGSYTQIKAVYSVKQFKLVQARYDSRTFWDDRGSVVARVRWQDAPKLRLFRLGPDSPDVSVRLGEEKTEASARLRLVLPRAMRISTGFGIEAYDTTRGRIDLVDVPGFPPVPEVPGLGTTPWFAHAFFAAGNDTRTSPEYSRVGHLFEAAIHSFNDVHDSQDPFGRFEAIAQQLIPTGSKGVIDVSAQTWISLSDGDQSVPFFLMPTLGGSNYLRAYPSYRFRDRHALFFRGEYRWPIHKMIDVAGLLEAGKVSPKVKGLKLSDMAESICGGIRTHKDTKSIVDLDVCHGRDGFKFTIGFNSGGS